jgi:hypothetical protein
MKHQLEADRYEAGSGAFDIALDCTRQVCERPPPHLCCNRRCDGQGSNAGTHECCVDECWHEPVRECECEDVCGYDAAQDDWSCHRIACRPCGGGETRCGRRCHACAVEGECATSHCDMCEGTTVCRFVPEACSTPPPSLPSPSPPTLAYPAQPAGHIDAPMRLPFSSSDTESLGETMKTALGHSSPPSSNPPPAGGRLRIFGRYTPNGGDYMRRIEGPLPAVAWIAIVCALFALVVTVCCVVRGGVSRADTSRVKNRRGTLPVSHTGSMTRPHHTGVAAPTTTVLPMNRISFRGLFQHGPVVDGSEENTALVE